MKTAAAIKKLTAAGFIHAPSAEHHTYTNGKFFVAFIDNEGTVQMPHTRRVGVFSDSRQDICADVFHANISQAIRRTI